MLEFRVLPDGQTIEVREDVWTWANTRTSYTYFNLALRKKARFLSYNNERTDHPDLCLDMTDSDVEWATKHYLPRISNHCQKEST